MIKEGDFVNLDYVGKVKESGEVFDVTSEEFAKKFNVFDEKIKYHPVTIIVGEKFLIKGVEDSLIGKNEGDSYSIEIKSVDAFGERNPELIKLIPTRYFNKEEITPYPGLRVNIDGLIGTIRSVSGGRVIVDFNHPLAGKDVEYEIKVNRILKDDKEKVLSLVSFFTGMSENECGIEISEKVVKIKIKEKEIPKEVKKRISELIKKHIKLEKVEFVEEY
ncbi:MAG: peptidylprolyl isomerase [Candidatus Parvarchaeota archaeon]|nr:peptidylprolyl isomerase [Candidatus Jingweiarchaeum tengchongense]MCW1297752.1 peptidylprolyl isomerase [Candidatus Jingweiarchaeum tengchongense]MCW1299762.1 peptidylprolyl isomerase [Candidatus Jingweiarchaeum tengchongense]MCW1304267.1 peptidylprolyl isomerase [Candidatus Jingweiarchaeum tengchongense]MCW1305295.1 peptidylprolyl isomerase [Candidatus Jingweiarchaeum tengchongense]